MKTAAILVAAGSSARMKSGGASKTMMEIGGEPVLSRTLRAFENAACISKIVIVARACDFDAIQKASAFVTKPLTITEGGKERQDSVSNGAALCGDAEYIAVHDAARPFITPEEIETVCADAEKYGAATLAVPATVKRSQSTRRWRISATSASTPQSAAKTVAASAASAKAHSRSSLPCRAAH